jgi:anti-sigma regulatory factor (Ser/Thr protein kinase)
MTDHISLTLPTAAHFRGVATLVLGGVGSRLDLPYERVDDLQLAVLSVLEASSDDRVTVEVAADDDSVLVSVGPLADGSRSDGALARVLDPLVDSFEASERDEHVWITLRVRR